MMKKKGIALLLSAMMICVAFAGCGDKQEEAGEISEPVKVAALNGPTGMAMVKLMDMPEKYDVTTYQAPTDITAKLVSGEVDVAAVPSNLAAVLYNKTDGGVQAVSPIALGMLHILSNGQEINDVSQLKGMTITASGKGGTPEYVLQKILEDNGLTIYEDVEVEWLSNHSEVNAKLLKNEKAVAMVPEPFVSTALAAGGDKVKDCFDLNELWKKATGEELPMGVLVARTDFGEKRGNDLRILLGDLQDSVDFVNDSPKEAAQLIVEKGFIGKAEIAEAAIPNCRIVLYSGDKAEDGAEMLDTFNAELYEMEPSSVGGKLPDDEMYWK